MASVRDHIGSPCPHCRRDILQAEPNHNRMPGADRAWCPCCQTTFDAAALARRPRGPAGLLRRLFGRSTPQ